MRELSIERKPKTCASSDACLGPCQIFVMERFFKIRWLFLQNAPA